MVKFPESCLTRAIVLVALPSLALAISDMFLLKSAMWLCFSHFEPDGVGVPIFCHNVLRNLLQKSPRDDATLCIKDRCFHRPAGMFPDDGTYAYAAVCGHDEDGVISLHSAAARQCLVLAASLVISRSDNPFFLLYDQNMILEKSFEDASLRLGVKLLPFEPLVTEEMKSSNYSTIFGQAERTRAHYLVQKLLVWKLFAGRYEKVFLLDTDVVVLQNIDGLFVQQPATTCMVLPHPKWHELQDNKTGYQFDRSSIRNAGFILLRPDLLDFNALVQRLDQIILMLSIREYPSLMALEQSTINEQLKLPCFPADTVAYHDTCANRMRIPLHRFHAMHYTWGPKGHKMISSDVFNDVKIHDCPRFLASVYKIIDSMVLALPSGV